MEICTDVIQSYLQGKIPMTNSWFYAYTNGVTSIAATRQEVCARLLEECENYRDFPLWNHDLITALFMDYDHRLREVVLLPIVGSHPNFDAAVIEHKGKFFLLIDLLNIADYTQSVKEMCYILHNLCHIHLLRYLFLQRFPKPTQSLSLLNYRFFCEGFLLYLAWNEDITSYVFHTPTYHSIKQKSFQHLYQALLMEETKRKQLLQVLNHVDLWDRFPDIAGMFFCDDVFHRQGTDGLRTYFSFGWQDSANRLFPDLN